MSTTSMPKSVKVSSSLTITQAKSSPSRVHLWKHLVATRYHRLTCSLRTKVQWLNTESVWQAIRKWWCLTLASLTYKHRPMALHWKKNVSRAPRTSCSHVKKEMSLGVDQSLIRTITDLAQKKRNWRLLESSAKAYLKAHCLSNMPSTTFRTTNMKVDQTWPLKSAIRRQTLLVMVLRVTQSITTAVLVVQLSTYLTEILISATPSAPWPSLLSMRTLGECLWMKTRMQRLSKSS